MARIGLEINPAKCEIVLPPSISEEQRTSTVSDIQQLLLRASVLPYAELTELGAPITQSAAEAVIARKEEELDLLLERLHCLDAHSAFFLLRNCLWLPKLQYLLRAVPMYEQQNFLQAIDSKLKSAVTGLINVRFEEPSWEQAVLPIRYGGLGLRRTEDVALPSYVASLHRYLQHASALLPSSGGDYLSQKCICILVAHTIAHKCKNSGRGLGTLSSSSAARTPYSPSLTSSPARDY